MDPDQICGIPISTRGYMHVWVWLERCQTRQESTTFILLTEARVRSHTTASDTPAPTPLAIDNQIHASAACVYSRGLSCSKKFTPFGPYMVKEAHNSRICGTQLPDN